MQQQPKLPLEDRLVKNRLGIYSALFMALRAKHPPTAAHALRVALGCSKWAMLRRMNETDRELLEIAALLHDLGKIGIPDRVLHKPDTLHGSEQSLMQLHIDLALELLTSAGASSKLLDIIRCYRRSENKPLNVPEEIQAAANMLVIVDAFDSMTSEQPFRSALPREVAIEELLKNTANQFEPALAAEFAKIAALPPPKLML